MRRSFCSGLFGSPSTGMITRGVAGGVVAAIHCHDGGWVERSPGISPGCDELRLRHAGARTGSLVFGRAGSSVKMLGCYDPPVRTAPRHPAAALAWSVENRFGGQGPTETR